MRILRQHGFELVASSGSHQKWRYLATGKQVIVAHHRGRILPLGAMRAVIAGSGIESDKWFD